MTPDRRRRIEAVALEALGRTVAERAAYLDGACADDAGLRSDVESLLAGQGEAAVMLESPPWAAPAEPLAPGTHLGPYEIGSAIGAGGMGQVYKARDTRLGRTVAIKVLPPQLASDPERRRRFEQEARAVSALNHPHICPLFDLGEAVPSRPESRASGRASEPALSEPRERRVEGQPPVPVHYLVLAHLEGQTLAARLAKGPLTVAQVLDVGAQIADALSAAHKAGILHRDLKPANVMLTKGDGGSEGRSGLHAMLLDFGLAKLAGLGEQPAVGFASASGDGRGPITARGTVLGTAPYMAPEQIEGKPADARADIWSLGAVLYEMLAGRRAFAGNTPATLMAAILEHEPAPLALLQPQPPPALARVVTKCLAKNPEDRWDSAHDVADELRWIAQSNGPTPAGLSTTPGRWSTRRALAFAAAASVVTTIGGVALFETLRPAPGQDRREVVRSLVSVAPADQLRAAVYDETGNGGRPSRTAIALSPDGRWLVFSAIRGGKQRLFRRALDQLEAVPMEGTEDGASPFFSPNGQWVGFWAGNTLKKTPTGGGPVTPVCNTPTVFGASWSSDDTIVIGRERGGLMRVPAAGGVPQPLTTVDTAAHEVSHRLPHVLPDGKAVVFTITRDLMPNWQGAELVVQFLATGVRKSLGRGADARYVPPAGALVFVREGALFTAPFDLSRMEVTGGAVSVLADVMQAANMNGSAHDSGAGQFSVSSTGALVYVPGGIMPDPARTLVWVDRAGNVQPLAIPPGGYLHPRLSADDQRLAVWTTGTDRNVWVFDIRRGTRTRLTTDGRNAWCVWTPDDTHVVYQGGAGVPNLFWKPADGSGAAERLTTSANVQVPASVSPDGQALAFVESRPTPGYDVFVVSLTGDRRSRPVLQSASTVSCPSFSPDWRWLAYVSNESGRNEVYVQPYPGPGGRHTVSSGGGTEPVWSRDGRELFYIRRLGTTEPWTIEMFSVPIATRPTFTTGIPRVLFTTTYHFHSATSGYDVTRDGRRFLMVPFNEKPLLKVAEVVLVQNWVEELKRRMAGK